VRKTLSIIAAVITAFLLQAVPSQAALSDYFVDSTWLAQNSGSVRIVDVRVGPKYLLSHIPGAVHIGKSEFLMTRYGVKSLVPDGKDLGKLLDRYGITNDTTVVAYAEDSNPYSARFVWMLRYHGHEKSYVLDGGFDKWLKDGGKVAVLSTRVKPTTGYTVRSSNDIRAGADYIYTRLHNPSVIIWDTRSPGEYNGTDVRADRGGHIPGSINLNWVDLQKEVDGVRVLKSEEEIRMLLSSKGITKEAEIVAHCQTGIRSSYATLVLKSMGYENARNYDGSWIEWANNASLPIEVPGKYVQNGKVTD